MRNGVRVDEPLDAVDIGFDDTNTPEIAPAEEVQTAIENLFSLATGTSRGFTFCQYNGNANTGRYLEFFSNISSNDAPLYSEDAFDVIEVVSATTATDATCTIGFYDQSTGTPGTLLYTVTFTAQKRVINTGSPLFTLPATGELVVKIDSGSIAKPHIYFVLKGSS